MFDFTIDFFPCSRKLVAYRIWAWEQLAHRSANQRHAVKITQEMLLDNTYTRCHEGRIMWWGHFRIMGAFLVVSMNRHVATTSEGDRCGHSVLVLG